MASFPAMHQTQALSTAPKKRKGAPCGYNGTPQLKHLANLEVAPCIPDHLSRKEWYKHLQIQRNMCVVLPPQPFLSLYLLLRTDWLSLLCLTSQTLESRLLIVLIFIALGFKKMKPDYPCLGEFFKRTLKSYFDKRNSWLQEDSQAKTPSVLPQ